MQPKDTRRDGGHDGSGPQPEATPVAEGGCAAQNDKSADTAAEEAEIRRRLEDLGYI